MHVGALLITNAQSAELIEPRERPLHDPAPSTKLEYLKPRTDAESRRAVILKHDSDHMPEFEITLRTGMRPSEQ